MVTIPYAAERMQKGLLYTVMQQLANNDDPLIVFANPAVQAVVEFKWAAFGKKLVELEFYLYLLWLLSFVVFLCLLKVSWLIFWILSDSFDCSVNHTQQHLVQLQVQRNKEDVVARNAMIIAKGCSFFSMLPFLVIEILQMINFGLIDWLGDVWNYLDMAMHVIQWLCLFEGAVSGVNFHVFKISLACQVILLFTKLQYFSR